MPITQPTLLTVPSNLNQLAGNLQALAPQPSEATQLITYALIATAMVGIFVYHYIKSQEASN